MIFRALCKSIQREVCLDSWMSSDSRPELKNLQSGKCVVGNNYVGYVNLGNFGTICRRDATSRTHTNYTSLIRCEHWRERRAQLCVRLRRKGQIKLAGKDGKTANKEITGPQDMVART